MSVELMRAAPHDCEPRPSGEHGAMTSAGTLIGRIAGSPGAIDAAQPTRIMHATAAVILYMTGLYGSNRHPSVQNSTPHSAGIAIGPEMPARSGDMGRMCARV